MLLVLCLGQGFARAQSEGGWNQLGKLPEGTSALAIDEAGSPALYAVGASGLSRSEDGGKSWTTCDADSRYIKLVQSSVTGNGAQSTLFATGWAGPKLSMDGCRT